MCFVDRPLLDLVASPDIHAIKDLKGKLVGISSRGGLHDVTMRRILAQSGMDPAQTTLITVGGQGAMLAAVQSRRIAAGLLNPPHNFMAYREGLKHLAFAGNFVRIPSTGLVTLRETMSRSPEQVRRMTRALGRARAFSRENKSATVAILKRFLRVDDEALIAQIYVYHRQAETSDGTIDATLASETIRDTRLAEGITRQIDSTPGLRFFLYRGEPLRPPSLSRRISSARTSAGVKSITSPTNQSNTKTSTCSAMPPSVCLCRNPAMSPTPWARSAPSL